MLASFPPGGIDGKVNFEGYPGSAADWRSARVGAAILAARA